MEINTAYPTWSALCLALCLVFIFSAGCRRIDMRDAMVATPGIRCEVCATKARQALRSLRGVEIEAVEFDFDDGAMLVSYDSMLLALKNIEKALNAAGFDANEMTADSGAVAALPPECRAHVD